MDQGQRVIAAVGAVIFKDDKVLLVRRGRPPFQGHWSIPGGKLDFGEALAEGLAREVREETGVVIDIVGLIDVYEALPQRPDDRHFVMIDYACRWISGEVVAGDDAMEAAFVPVPEALSRLAWDKTRTAIQDALKVIRRKEEQR
ncbi:NUDIX hydrolase [Parvularcula sp. LCG005]|uniref:NUDIX hydrolase n=1 Tax=Parvularcula sp. LCG005 TaxID=3078805 RepID=UPI0029432710|nr:NUDIX hydrolase [Parvularcula sp. LCG005]WOI54733.1 NUDIX hydrolase [Parvularcula sp. LCG005]